LLLPSASLLAQAPGTPTPEQLQAKAVKHEQSGKWELAVQIWLQLYNQDKQNLEVRERLQVCLRHLLQHQRFIDDSVREKLVSLNHTDALSLYSEVLNKLHNFYVDRSKVMPDRLYQQGVEEFTTALGDATFREAYLKKTPHAKVKAFQTELREVWAKKDVLSVKHARELLTEIVIKCKKDLEISKPSVVIVEFLAGACNSLDEYSAYLTPNQLAAEVSETMSHASVTDIQMPRDGVGYFRIAQFKDTTATEVDNAVNTLRMQARDAGLRVIIMDLRGNPGGLFSASIQVAERFLPDGVIVTTQGSAVEVNKTFQAAGGPNVVGLPLIVLVDAGTASAAEALAGALRDQNRATLIGTTTFGKGTVQRVITFSTAEDSNERGKTKSRTGGIRITLARFFSPNGQPITGTGISPHISEQDKMRQLDIALEHAGRFTSPVMMTPRP
jgi:C-terminal processing protease CtpA/Prc